MKAKKIKNDDKGGIIRPIQGSHIVHQESGNVFIGNGPIQIPMYDEQGRQIVGQENIRAEVARREAEKSPLQLEGKAKPSLFDQEPKMVVGGPIQIPMYDEQGRQIVGQENIRAEVARREAEKSQLQLEGKAKPSLFDQEPKMVVGGPIQIPMYDEQGRQIVGQENIRAEVARREAEKSQLQLEGKAKPSLFDQEPKMVVGGPIQIPMYDEQGRQIVGQENIRAEVARREAEKSQLQLEGKAKPSLFDQEPKMVVGGPIQIPMYDEQGRQIVGQENIRAEVARRQGYRQINWVSDEQKAYFLAEQSKYK